MRAVVRVGRRDFQPVARREPAEGRVKDDKVEHAVDNAEDVALADVDPVGDAVARRVLPCGSDRVRVDVDRW